MVIENISFKNILRQPIITVAGHIDHGKTTFINYIGKFGDSNIEYGGITQHIKSYNFKTNYGYMTFLDTPGHFAFNSLRENSIRYSDIVLLVIAVDDGIKPQTAESIDIAKRFSIPVIVAINKVDKIDKKSFKNDKLMSDLSKHGLVPEDWGGDTIVSYISAKTGEGVNELLELISLQSDVLDLKIDFTKPSYGIVLDNRIDLGLGVVTTLILKNGILKNGDILQVNNNVGKIKSIFDLNGSVLSKGSPSLPINVTGLSSSLDIGELFFVNNDLRIKKVHIKKKILFDNNHVENYDLDYFLKKSLETRLNLIIKVDVQGSVTVLRNAIGKLSTSKIKVIIVKIELGSFNESDIDLASATNSILIGFNVKTSYKINKLASSKFVKFYSCNVIYDLIDFVNLEIKNKRKRHFGNMENKLKI